MNIFLSTVLTFYILMFSPTFSKFHHHANPVSSFLNSSVAFSAPWTKEKIPNQESPEIYNKAELEKIEKNYSARLEAIEKQYKKQLAEKQKEISQANNNKGKVEKKISVKRESELVESLRNKDREIKELRNKLEKTQNEEKKYIQQAGEANAWKWTARILITILILLVGVFIYLKIIDFNLLKRILPPESVPDKSPGFFKSIAYLTEKAFQRKDAIKLLKSSDLDEESNTDLGLIEPGREQDKGSADDQKIDA